MLTERVVLPLRKELMSTSIGPLRKLAMNFRQNGQSTGVCTVEFQRADDANRAYQQFNNRLIDGKKPLKVEVVVDPAKVPVQQPAARASVHGSSLPALQAEAAD